MFNIKESLKLEHVSYSSKIIFSEKSNHKIIYRLQYKNNQIGEINVVNDKRAIKNMNDHMAVMMNQLKKEYHSQHSTGEIKNVYNTHPTHMNNFISVNLFDIIDRIKHWQENKDN